MSSDWRLFDPDELTGAGPAPVRTREQLDRVIVRVLPDVSGIAKEFDYLVEPDQLDQVAVGCRVRIELSGRRVGGWVTEIGLSPPATYRLRPLLKVASVGPLPATVDLARWAAHRWSGRVAALLHLASPPRQIAKLPAGTSGRSASSLSCRDQDSSAASAAGSGAAVTVIRHPPCADQAALLAALCRRGDTMVVCPQVELARAIGGRLRRDGLAVRQHPRDWVAAAGRGGVVIGARSAIWARVPELRAIVVVDEHDESLQETRNPTWHARDVAIERAKRAAVPCYLLSPCPSVVALQAADRVEEPSRSAEREGWPIVEVIDRRGEEPGRSGLFSSRVVALLRGPGRVVVLLNRKGRSVLSACSRCGELVRTSDGERLMVEADGQLLCPATGETRPLVCASCGATVLKRLRLGVNRAAEELSALLGEPVDEVTAPLSGPATAPTSRVVIGTEAVLNSVAGASCVVLLDIDSELHAPRYRAGEQAMQLLARAARLVGPRSGGGRLVVQTRTPDHRVLQAAVRADPGRLASTELELRRAMGMPPFGALAEISGAGAAELVASLAPSPDGSGGNGGPVVLGPNREGRYLVRAADAEALAALLASAERPSARVRVAVDPPRA